jgi:hypothetical protein
MKGQFQKHKRPGKVAVWSEYNPNPGTSQQTRTKNLPGQLKKGLSHEF